MTTVRIAVSRALLGPALLRDGLAGLSRGASLLTSACVCIGLFTLSWDRLANVGLGGYNVKLPALTFTVAAVAAIPAVLRRDRAAVGRVVAVAAALVAAIAVVLVLSSALSEHPAAGVAQIAAVLTGAIAPAVAVYGVVSTRAHLLWAIGWLLAGAAFASLFGVYQLVAFYAGWPQLIDYTGVGVGGEAGRIAAFSYEPAYFANFLILALGAAVAGAVLRGRVLGWLPVSGFAAVLVLVNVRALYFLVPALLLMLALHWRQNRRVLLRVVIAAVAVVAVDVAATAMVQEITRQAIVRPLPSAAAPSVPVPTATADAPEAPSAAADSPTNVLNPNEQSSNAPRLALYSAVLQATSDHPVLGVGPGNLRYALAEDGYAPPNQGNQVVANNIWLQAFADGGVLLVLLELALVVVMAVLLFRRRLGPVQPLIAAWLAVVGVSGMLTSYFFDVKMWVVLGLVLAAVGVFRAGTTVTPGRRRAAR